MSFVYLQEGAYRYEDCKHWKREYEELEERVKWMEKKVDEERRAVLRRYRLQRVTRRKVSDALVGFVQR
jgi:predicted Fe-S protein YdhL (DUF1289 family)